MAFTLHLYFAGLNCFAANHRQTEMRCLMLDLRRPYWSSTGERIPPHTGLVVYEEANRLRARDEMPVKLADILAEPGVSDVPHLMAKAAAPPPVWEPGLAFWRLDGEDLEIRPGGLPAARHRLHVVYDRRQYLPDGSPRNRLPDFSAGEEKDFSWVAELQHLNATGDSRLDPDVKAADPQLGLLVGRVLLTEGQLSTFRLAEVDGRVFSYEFKPLGASSNEQETQALAEVVECQVAIDHDWVTLQSRRFGDHRLRSVDLAPRGKARDVHVAFVNFPPHEGCCGQEGGVSDLELCYELFQARPPIRNRPVPHRTARESVPSPPAPTLPVLHWLYAREWAAQLQIPGDSKVCPVAQCCW